LYIHLREEFTPCQQFPEREIENLKEQLPTFLNPSWRFQESPSCFGVKYFKTLKWQPKIKGGTERKKKSVGT